jgi:hypothetical protein
MRDVWNRGNHPSAWKESAMSQLKKTTGIGNVFQHVGKENDIERLQTLDDDGRKWFFINFQAPRTSNSGPVRIRFDPDNFSIPSVRDHV